MLEGFKGGGGIRHLRQRYSSIVTGLTDHRTNHLAGIGPIWFVLVLLSLLWCVGDRVACATQALSPDSQHLVADGCGEPRYVGGISDGQHAILLTFRLTEIQDIKI